MRIKIMYPNQYGKLEFTKAELEKLLSEAYDEGYNDGRKNYSSSSLGYYSSPTVTLMGSSVCADTCSTPINTAADYTTTEVTSSTVALNNETNTIELAITGESK